MEAQFSRTALLLGEEAVRRLNGARVAIFGVGGVGGFAAEALIRAGVGGMDLYDNDVVSESNLNRQIVALHSTIGRSKVEVMRERMLDIQPGAQIAAHQTFYLPELADSVPWEQFDYVVDCIDTVKAKLDLAEQTVRRGIPFISAMGAGNKLDPTAFEVADLSQTSVCPLARVMRQELKKRGIFHLKVVYSREIPLKPQNGDLTAAGRPAPGSVSFCPSVAGLILASEVVKDLSGGF